MISTLKDLEKLLKLCRKQGVDEIKLGDVSLKFGELPLERRQSADEPQADDPLEGFPEGMLTPEQLMFYSSGGLPKDDPILNADKAN